MRLSGAVAVVLLWATTPAAAADKPKLDMVAFFTGRTHADNVLKVALRRATPLIVDSVGGIGDRGDFVLIDTIHEGDKPVRTRKWIMRQAAPGRYTGSLSDAIGPVNIVMSGDTATIRYKMKGGLDVVELMQLQGDGRTIANHVVVKNFGLRVARVDGTIRKLD